MSFSEILELIKDGHLVYRESKPNEPVGLFSVVGKDVVRVRIVPRDKLSDPEYIAVVLPGNIIAPYSIRHEDVLANDWRTLGKMTC